MKVLRDNVLVYEAEKASQTPGGLYLVDTAAQKAVTLGIVVNYGPESDSEIYRGAKVYFDWSKAMSIVYEGREAAIVSSSEILAVE